MKSLKPVQCAPWMGGSDKPIPETFDPAAAKAYRERQRGLKVQP